MKVLWGLGKVLTLLFWLVVLVNLVTPLISPFHMLVSLAGSLLLLTHLLEVLLFNGSVRERAHPWQDRARILVFGIFHVQMLPLPSREEVSHA